MAELIETCSWRWNWHWCWEDCDSLGAHALLLSYHYSDGLFRVLKSFWSLKNILISLRSVRLKKGKENLAVIQRGKKSLGQSAYLTFWIKDQIKLEAFLQQCEIINAPINRNSNRGMKPIAYQMSIKCKYSQHVVCLLLFFKCALYGYS